MPCKKLRRIRVSGGYRGPLLDWPAAHCRCRLQVVLHPDAQQGIAVLPRRWGVERTSAWLNQHRRLSKNYEVLPFTSEAIVYMTQIMSAGWRLPNLFRQFLRVFKGTNHEELCDNVIVS